MDLPEAHGDTRSWAVIKDELQAELRQAQQELNEIPILLDESERDVKQLQERSASISAHLQQVLSQIDKIPPEEIRVAYDAALDAQQRLVVTRGQLEKLQNDKSHLTRFIDMLEAILQALEGGSPEEIRASKSFATAEMMIQAQESERSRLSKQMHDGPAQALSNFILQTEIAMRLFDVDHDQAREELSNLKTSATTTFQHVRDFIFDLRPMMLDDLGLFPTIQRYVDAFKEKHGLDVQLSTTGVEIRLEPYLEVMVFRSIQELLTNIYQHSQANQVKIQIDATDTRVKASIEDNGKGFEAESELAKETNLGLRLIKDRVEMLGGTFDMDSTIGQGSHISFEIPIENTEAQD